MDKKQISQLLETAHDLQTVGPASATKRAVTKFISHSLRTTVVGTVVLGAAHLMGVGQDKPDSAPTSRPAHHIQAAAPARRADFSEVQQVSSAHMPRQNQTARADFVPRADDTSLPQYKLPISLKGNESVGQIAQKLYNAGNLFQAATIQVEGLHTAPYYIEGHGDEPTVGVGYNVKKSIGARGRGTVQQELTQAGISPDNVAMLMSPDRSVSKNARITQHQALALFDISAKKFESSTRSAIGANVYNKLPKHQQAALMMHDYNANIHDNAALISAVRRGDNIAAIENLETRGPVNGKVQRIAGSGIFQAMFHDSHAARDAVMNPERIKRAITNGYKPWLDEQDNQVQTRVAQNDAPRPLKGSKVQEREDRPEVTSVRASPEVNVEKMSPHRLKGAVENIRDRVLHREKPQERAPQSEETPSFLRGPGVNRIK